MNAYARLSVEFELPEHGWLPMRLSYQDRELELLVSNVLWPALHEIVGGLCRLLLQGSGQARLMLEPDECLLIFDDSGLTALHAPNAPGTYGPDSKVLFRVGAPPAVLVRRFLVGLDALRRAAEERPAAFRENWGAFPDLTRLRELYRSSVAG